MTSHAADYATNHGVFTFTSITVYEIVYGLELKGASSQLKKVLAWLKQNEEITPIDADYLAAASIKAAARMQGSVVELNRVAGEPLDIYVNNKLMARGEAVVVKEKFGVRITDVLSPEKRIEGLG